VNFVGKKRQNPFLWFVREMRKVLQECEGGGASSSTQCQVGVLGFDGSKQSFWFCTFAFVEVKGRAGHFC
jgi:hypothetical protein